MDDSGISALWHLRSKSVGKVKRRVQDLRNPSFDDLFASKPTLDLSHNESARLAVDSLLSTGLAGYQEVLTAEGEVDFLSEEEKRYIVANGGGDKEAVTADDVDHEEQLEGFSVDSLSLTCCPAVSTDSDPSVPGLDLGSLNGVKVRDLVLGEPSVEMYFQSGMKDMIREFIRKASMALAIVVNTFSDVELLCDVLEASSKRNVCVHLLLEPLHLNVFLNMCQDLNVSSKLFPKLSVRSVGGQTYYAKTGRKFTGQMAENFIIIDWTEVLTGSYSFSWLSWQVHRNIAVLLKGEAVTPFLQEFQRLYASSTPVSDLLAVLQQLPRKRPFQKDLSGISSPRPGQAQTAGNWALTEERKFTRAQNTQEAKFKDIPPYVPSSSKPQATTPECGKADTYSTTQHLHRREIVHSTQTTCQTQANPKPDSKTQHPTSKIQVCVGGISSIRTEQCVFVENRMHDPTDQSVSTRDKNTAGECPGGLTVQKFLQGRTRNIGLSKASGTAVGLNMLQGQQKESLTCIQSRHPPCSPFQVDSPSAPQENADDLWPYTQEMSHMVWTKPQVSSWETRRQVLQRYLQPQIHIKPPGGSPHSKLLSPGVGTNLQVQPKADPTSSLPGMGTMLQTQAQNPQRFTSPPKQYLIPQRHSARPRPVVHQRSFSNAYGTGQMLRGHLGWRPFHNNVPPPLGRSNSLLDRHSAVFQGSNLNPNTSKK